MTHVTAQTHTKLKIVSESAVIIQLMLIKLNWKWKNNVFAEFTTRPRHVRYSMDEATVRKRQKEREKKL